MNGNDDIIIAPSAMAVGGKNSLPVQSDRYGHVEARVRAEVQARTALAVARPRDFDVARQRLLADCRRLGFAEVAEYAIPRAGTTIRGPSIRFAESLARALGNISIEVSILHEDDERRVCEVSATDLESNITYRHAFSVRKVIERRKLPPNARAEDVVGSRTGSDGQTIYLLRASEQDIAMQQAAQASRVIRGLILRLAPSDLVEEGLRVCRECLEARDREDPSATRKRLADAFLELGIHVEDLVSYLGHPLDRCTPDEIARLRGIYAALRDGATTWREVVESSSVQAVTATQASSPANQADNTPAAKVREALRRQSATSEQSAATPDAAQDAPQASPPSEPAQLPDWLARLAKDCPHLTQAEIETVVRGVLPDPASWDEAPLDAKRQVRRTCYDMERVKTGRSRADLLDPMQSTER